LLLDLLATGDWTGVDAAVELYASMAEQWRVGYGVAARS
jgi:hypothetical protein